MPAKISVRRLHEMAEELDAEIDGMYGSEEARSNAWMASAMLVGATRKSARTDARIARDRLEKAMGPDEDSWTKSYIQELDAMLEGRKYESGTTDHHAIVEARSALRGF